MNNGFLQCNCLNGFSSSCLFIQEIKKKKKITYNILL